jgi:hypothetical protein
MSVPQLFGIVPTGAPVITTPSNAVSETSYIYTLPARPFNHIVVFLLPGIELPPDTGASVYLAPNTPLPAFKFLGAIGPGKESAIFKVAGGNDDMSAAGTPAREMLLGISVEPAAQVAAQMATLASSKNSGGASSALVPARASAPDTLQLAQRIIKNAFNFLASFSGNVPIPGATGTAGVEVVPLKAFEDWWKKFEGRIRSDPGFLERDSD